MNLFKRTTASVALIALVSSVFTTGVSAASSDEIAAASALATKGYINTQTNVSDYNLDMFISRAEISKVAANVAELSASASCEGKFADVSATTPNDWVCGYVEALLANGFVSANANYNPNANLTKAEAVKLMLTVAGEEVAFEAATWQADFVSYAVENGFVSNFSDYNTSATRGFVFSVAAAATSTSTEEEGDDILSELDKLLGGDDEDDTMTEEEDDTTTVVSGDSELMVELSPLSPNASIVAAGKDRTPFLAFDVTAGSSDVELDDILITYVGLSDSSGFDKLAVYLGNDKVTKQSSKGFDSDEEADLTFENDTVIKAGETKTLVVSGLIAAAGSVAHKIEVTEINASASVTLGDVVSVVFDTVDASNTATLDIDVDSVTSTPTIGETVTFAEFTLEEKLDNEDVVVKSITLEFGGGVDAEDDIADIVLLAEGEVVASDIMINDDDEVVIDLEYTVAADESIDFELEGVITDSIGQTLTVTLTEVYAIGADTGIIAGLTGDSLPTISGNFATVDGSEINVSFDKGDADEAKPGAEDVLVGTLNLKATSDYTINELTVTAVASGTGVNNIVKDLELDGKSFDSESGGVFKFEDISLDAGVETMLDLTLELEDEVALNGSSIEFTIAIVEVEDEENDELFNAGSTPDLDSVLSSNSFDNKSIDVETASYKLTQSKVSQRELVLGNGIEVVLYQGKLNIGDADSVTLRDIVFNGTITSTGSYDLEDIIDSATLNIGGVTDSADVEVGTLEFNSANIEVAAGSDNVEVLLTAILKDNDSVNNGDTISFTTTASDIVSEDSDTEDLVSGAGVVNAASSATIVQLNERGTFAIAVVNDGENEDVIEDVVLAGTNSITLAEVVFEAEEEDMDVKELRFTLSGAFDDSVKNVRLMDGSSVIADGATVTLSGANTVIEFEDFVVEDSGEEIDATLVADLNVITTEGGVVSATAGDIVVLALTALDMDIEGANSDDTITADLTNNVNSDAVSIVPVLVTASVASTNDQFSDEEEQAFVSIDLDMGQNDLDSDDVVLTTIEFSTASGAALFNNPNAFVKIDNTEVTYTVSGSIMTITTEGDINDGDKVLFSIDATTDASRVKIIENGISFTVDGAPYSANTGDDELDLGRYTTDQDN